MEQLDENKIPKGDYCYDGDYICPYWSIDETRPKQENGYCMFLKKGDWDINLEAKLVDTKTGKVITKPGEESPFPVGLIWDEVKECGKNKWTDEEWEQRIKEGHAVRKEINHE